MEDEEETVWDADYIEIVKESSKLWNDIFFHVLQESCNIDRVVFDFCILETNRKVIGIQ